MSTTFNGSNPSLNGANPSVENNTATTNEDGIIHFDATQVRKERMKQMAAAELAKKGNAPVESAPAAPAPVAQTPPAPAPVAPAPVAPAAPSPAMTNGHAAQPVAPAPVAPAPVAPAPVAAAPQAPAAPAQAKGGVRNASGEELSRPELESFLVNFVVEQTGYPEEMVELDADLEADLGIDSIKKAQMFGELAEHLKVEIEITEDMSLDDYPTLTHIVDFLLNPPAPSAAPVAPTPVAQAPAASAPVAPAAPSPAMTNGHAAQPVAPAPVAPAPSAPAPVAAAPQAPATPAPSAPTKGGVRNASGEELSRPELESFLVNFVVEQTGYPEEMVELDADLEADLGIDSIKKAQMFGELAEHLKVEIEITEDMSLDDYPTLTHIVDFLLNPPAPSAASAPVATAPAAPTPVAQAPAAPAPVAPAPAATVAPAMTNGHAAQPVAPAPVAPAPVAPAPVAATPQAPAAPAAPKGGVRNASGEELSRPELESFLVNFVVEQTGYPEEMVELDADLEADLGIDSIKKAQMFGELAEHLKVEIEITEDMSLDDYPTLNHIVDFLMS